MWFSFCLAALFSVVLLVLPGYFILRVFGQPRQTSVMCAAPVTCCVLAVAGIAFDAVGFKGVSPVLIAAAAVSVIMLAVLLAKGSHASVLLDRNARLNSGIDSKRGWHLLLFYPLVSCLVLGYYFILPLDGASSFLQIGDNAVHLNTIASMVDGGSLSSMSSDVYSAMSSDNEVPLDSSSSFYPVGWHIITAIVVAICNVGIPLAENAVNLVFVAVVFPLGCFAILRAATKGNLAIEMIGAFAVCACAAFPLRTLVVHQIYPNVAGLCVVFSIIYLGIVVLGRLASREPLFPSALSFFLALIGGVLLHPNISFVCGIALVSFVVFEFLPRQVDFRSNALKSKKLGIKIVLGGIAVGVAVIIWLLLLNSGALASLTSFLWTWTVSAGDAFSLVVSMGLRQGIPQYVLSVVVLFGFVYCLVKRDSAWLSVTYAVICLLFFFNASGSPEVKRLFSGFWYTDPERTAALVAIFAVPLTAYGLYFLYSIICRFVPRFANAALCRMKKGGGRAIPARGQFAVGAVVVGLFSLCVYFPLSFLGLPPSAIEATAQELEYNSNRDNALFYDSSEQAFVEKAKEIVPEGALVINMPHDGSVFAYAVDDLNVYYKSTSYDGEKTACEEIRLHLSDYSEDEAVQNAVESTGAQFILLLNRGDEKNFDSNSWDPSAWKGFEALDECPCFEAVLAEGDMRLYRIKQGNGD